MTTLNLKSLALFLALLPALSHAETIKGNVIRVSDGDTITVVTAAKKFTIRLAQVDAPEIAHFGNPAQPFGKESGAYLKNMVNGKAVRVEIEDVDQYGRSVGTIFLGMMNVNAKMVESGNAWVYRQYAHDTNLIPLENTAKLQRRGLWAYSNPIAPWDFRKANK